jgi:hypothetical protein
MSMRYDNPLARSRAIRRVQAIERFLDNAFMLPLIRIRAGFDGVLGLVPVLGNAVTTAISLALVYYAVRLGVKPWTLVKMLGNVAIDFVIGEIPVAGDIADFLFKANKRNLALLREELSNDPAFAAQSVQQWASQPVGTASTHSSGQPSATRRYVANLAKN